MGQTLDDLSSVDVQERLAGLCGEGDVLQAEAAVVRNGSAGDGEEDGRDRGEERAVLGH